MTVKQPWPHFWTYRSKRLGREREALLSTAIVSLPLLSWDSSIRPIGPRTTNKKEGTAETKKKKKREKEIEKARRKERERERKRERKKIEMSYKVPILKREPALPRSTPDTWRFLSDWYLMWKVSSTALNPVQFVQILWWNLSWL